MNMNDLDPKKLAAMEDGFSVAAGYLTMYVIYDHPRDFPAHFVVRQHRVNGTWNSVSAIGILCASLDEARQQIPLGMVCLSRDESDDPVIVETWI